MRAEGGRIVEPRQRGPRHAFYDATPKAGFARPDLTAFCRLDHLGLEVTGRRKCTGCGHVWRQDATAAAEPRAKLTRGEGATRCTRRDGRCAPAPCCELMAKLIADIIAGVPKTLLEDRRLQAATTPSIGMGPFISHSPDPDRRLG
jgi:hypothetical protein